MLAAGIVLLIVGVMLGIIELVNLGSLANNIEIHYQDKVSTAKRYLVFLTLAGTMAGLGVALILFS